MWGHSQAVKETLGGIGGWLGDLVVCSLYRRICWSQRHDSAFRQVSYVVEGLWWEAFMPGGDEFRIPKTLPKGDISI